MKRKVLLIEPNYKNKYPPIGLMKLATYHRKLGDEVVFFKGEFKTFIQKQVIDELIEKLFSIDNKVNWLRYYSKIKEYISKGSIEILGILVELTVDHKPIIKSWFQYYFNYYRKGEYKNNPKWDRICISTLFTFHWKITIETIKQAFSLVKNKNELWVGGVLATVLASEVEKETGVKPFKGLLDKPGILDQNDVIIDKLPLDYSILNEIEYIYPENNAYYGYMTRGCIRKCDFCVVWKLEPKFDHFVSIKEYIEKTSIDFGEKRNLLLLDNNVIASKKFDQIIDEIKQIGFSKGAKFVEPDHLYIAEKKLIEGYNEHAYVTKIYYLFQDILKKAHPKEKQKIYDLLEANDLLSLQTSIKPNIIKVLPELKIFYNKYRNTSPKLRYVDFNQGLDARLMTEDKIKKLSEIPIKPLRLAFDNLKYQDAYVQSIRWAAKYGIKDFSNYLLYNFDEKPEELYFRLKLNVELCEELNIAIYSFPMKYLPIDLDKYYMNRDYVGSYWNKKYLRAVQAILNSTKGKIGRGLSFFNKAFGEDIDKYFELLNMPETYIIYRYFFEHIGYIDNWRNDFNSLNQSERKLVLQIIANNIFSKVEHYTKNEKIIQFLHHYTAVTRDSIIEPKSELYKLKKEYDKSGRQNKDVQRYKEEIISFSRI
jgi:hypothetical protein